MEFRVLVAWSQLAWRILNTLQHIISRYICPYVACSERILVDFDKDFIWFKLINDGVRAVRIIIVNQALAFMPLSAVFLEHQYVKFAFSLLSIFVSCANNLPFNFLFQICCEQVASLLALSLV